MRGIRVIGAGLAGCEAAFQAAELGVPVELLEMKPVRFSPAHKNPDFGELVCSNSLRSSQLSNAVGLLKEEMRRLGSLIINSADKTQVPAGSCLAVDRVAFAETITQTVKNHPLITVKCVEAEEIPDDGVITVVATGPLTDGKMAESIGSLFSGDSLSFFDAVAPIVDASSVNREIAYFATRYGKGDPMDYLNCPMNREQYDGFYQALITAEEAELHDFDKSGEALTVFEGCMPVEVMAKRGYDTLRFGPMKPVGLPDPKTGEDPFAVVQLRRENKAGTMFNLVGFQTHLTWGEQKRVFGMIPGLENASFFRYGVMHRNTYINSPGKLSPQYEVLKRPGLFFAGQMTGVEGYVESASSGFVAGISAALEALGKPLYDFPSETEIGALGHYISEGGTGKFQPMNANFGIIAPLPAKVKGGKIARNDAYGVRSLETVENIKTYLSSLRPEPSVEKS